jgi:hypothetical protein
MRVVEPGHVYELDQQDEERGGKVMARIPDDVKGLVEAARTRCLSGNERHDLLAVVERAIVQAQRTLVFVNREDEPHAGTQTQEVLRVAVDMMSVLIDRTLHCHGCLPWTGNERIVTAMAEAQRQMRLALLVHEERALERKMERDGWKPERAPLGEDGHFLRPGEAEVKSAGFDGQPEVLAGMLRGYRDGDTVRLALPCEKCGDYYAIVLQAEPTYRFSCTKGPHEFIRSGHDVIERLIARHEPTPAPSVDDAAQKAAGNMAEASVRLSNAMGYLSQAHGFTAVELALIRPGITWLIARLDHAVDALRCGDRETFTTTVTRPWS